MYLSLSVGATSLYTYTLHSQQDQIGTCKYRYKTSRTNIATCFRNTTLPYSKKSDNLDDLTKFIFDSSKVFSNFTNIVCMHL